MSAPLQTLVTQTRRHYPQDLSFLFCKMRALLPPGAAVRIPGVLFVNMAGPKICCEFIFIPLMSFS